jgi:PAS domain S-box-containing protein
MSETAGYSTLERSRGINRPWRVIDKSLATQFAQQLAKSAFVAFLYYLLVVISMKLRFSTSGLSLLWPSNALLLATLILTPKSRWWAYLLAIIPAHIAAMSSYHVGLSWLAYQVAFNSVLTVACAAVLQRFRPEILYFETLREVLIFLTVSIAVPGVVNLLAIYPVVKFSSKAVLLAHDSADGFIAVWTSCWINNTASLLAFVPTILVCLTRGRSWLRSLPVRRVVEGTLLTVVFIAISSFAYRHADTMSHFEQALYLIPLPLLLWAAVRLGPTAACLSITALVCLSSWCAYAGEGPFLHPTSIDRVTAMQMSWIMISAPVLALAAVVRERKLATLASEESESRFAQLFEQATVGVVVESLDGHIRNVNPTFCQLLAYSKDELTSMTRSSLSNQEDGEAEKHLLRELLSGDRSSYQLEKRFLRKDGKEIWGYVRVSLLKEPGVRPPLVLGIVEDVTARKVTEGRLRQLTGRLMQAQEDERRRISRELHDDLGQQASVLVNDLAVLRSKLSVLEQPGIIEQATKLHRLASDLASDIHQLSHELHSSRLQHLGLGPALSELGTRVSSQRPISVEIHVDHLPRRIPQDVALCLFRIAQEALTNVMKHSQAQTVIVEGKQNGMTVCLSISDDGIGFDPTVSSSGIGLASMRERLRLVDGELLINSSLHHGTEVIAQVRITDPGAYAASA